MNPGRPLRVAFFGGATRFSCLALEALAARQQVVTVVAADRFWYSVCRSLARTVGLSAASPLLELARQLRIPVTFASDAADGALAEKLRKLRPDLICVAVYPKLLGRSTLDAAPLGTVNAHPSLLPRHRGPLPIFWTYFCDDRQTGVTIHHANEHFDSGDVILQERQDVPRCYPAQQLDVDLGRTAARLLVEAVEQIAAGTANRSRQDDREATRAPRITAGARMVPFEAWNSERIWHFLGGLSPRYREPLADEHGRPVPYDRVPGYEIGRSLQAAGSVETVTGGWKLHCRDGIVMLSRSKV